MANVGFNPAEKTIHYKILFGNREKDISLKKDDNINKNTYYNKYLEKNKTKSTGNSERDKILDSARKFDENGNYRFGNNNNVIKEEPSTWQKIKNFFSGEDSSVKKKNYSSGNYTRNISDSERKDVLDHAKKFDDDGNYRFGDL